MAAIEAEGVTYRYGGNVALDDVSLAIPEGAFYALLGPNGAGKTTLLQILAGLRRAQSGHALVNGCDAQALRPEDRASLGYLAAGQPLPDWMRLEQLEAWLTPLYATWDMSLAKELRTRFRLDGRRRLKTLSRGERMKAALLCTLAPRPRVLLMDEPFEGMDVMVRDDIVGGLLDMAGSEGWTVMISSHDIAELEMLCDRVGLLDRGRLRLSESLDSVRERFRHVEVMLTDDDDASPVAAPDWIAVRRAGRRIRFLTTQHDGDVASAGIRARFPTAARVEVRPASLREVFVAVVGDAAADDDRVSADVAYPTTIDTARKS